MLTGTVLFFYFYADLYLTVTCRRRVIDSPPGSTSPVVDVQSSDNNLLLLQALDRLVLLYDARIHLVNDIGLRWVSEITEFSDDDLADSIKTLKSWTIVM